MRSTKFAFSYFLTILVAPAVAGLMLCNASRAHAVETAEAAKQADERLSEDVAFLASDELEGRGVGTKGIDLAADYLAAEFTKLGLKTDLFEGQPFQKFELNLSAELGPKEQNTLQLVGPPGADGQPQQWSLQLDKDFTPLAAGGSGKIDAPLVFAGYGITAKELGYDDYAGLDVKGKVVIVVRKEPQQDDPKSKFEGDKNSQHAPFMRKISNAFEHGAAAIIFVNDAHELTNRREEEKKLAAAHGGKLPADPHAKPEDDAGKTEPTEEKEAAEPGAGPDEDYDELIPFAGTGDTGSNRKTPVYFVKRAPVDSLIKQALKTDLATIEKQIDTDLKPRSAELAGYRAVGEANIVQRQTEVKNVIAVLEGHGPLADETIVVGAHYDHLGLGGNGSLAPWTKEIHNGADDNASGTATLLEIAHQLVASGKQPRRRVVFMAFTGEERGLLGSAHYVRSPRFSLERTVAMFNLDMVGRLTDNKLIVYGTGTATQFEPLIDRLAKEGGFELTKYAGGYGPSDHSSFYSKKIPVLHFFTGTHTDYHRPSDDSGKLNIDGMRRVAEMVVDVVQTTDASDARPAYVDIKKVEVIGGGDADRPYFGSIPDFGNNAEGYAISGATGGSPADKGGLKGGDVITQLGDSKIANLEDFDSALRKYKIGDTVKVVVKRDGKDVELQVVLERRKP